jgi:predicted CXXCH cytochrome family protein
MLSFTIRKGGFAVKLGDRLPYLQHSIIVALFLVFFSASGERAWGGDFPFGDSTTRNAACMACHEIQATVGTKNYIDPTNFGHTTQAKFGCTTCHDAVSSSHPDGKAVARTTNCKDCHSEVIAQYSTSPHASNAPCGGCHNPHRVYKPDEISADDMNKQCGGCHTKNKITASHAQWLPQTGLHLEAIACVTCHSKAESYVITIYIAKRHGSDSESKPVAFDELRKMAAGDDIQNLIDRNRDNYISLDELRTFNRSQSNKDIYLKSMLTPVKPTHSFQTFDNRFDCSFCHTSGPAAMQVSYLAFPERDGTFRKVAVEKGAVMDALHTLPDFYLMGSTRNGVLNKLGLLIIVGGLVMPVGHGFFRFLSRNNRK